MAGNERLENRFKLGDKVYNQKLKIYGIIKIKSKELHIEVEEDPIGDWYLNDMILITKCHCTLNILMVEGCQCGGN